MKALILALLLTHCAEEPEPVPEHCTVLRRQCGPGAIIEVCVPAGGCVSATCDGQIYTWCGEP